MRVTSFWAATLAGTMLVGTAPVAASAAPPHPVPGSRAGVTTSTTADDQTPPPVTPRRAPAATVRADRLAAPASAQTAKDYLAARRSTFAVDPAQLKETGTERVPGSPVVAQRFRQVVGGIPVHGSGYVVRLRADAGGSTVVGTSGTYYTGLAPDTHARLSPEQVVTALVRAHRGPRSTRPTVQVGGLVIAPLGKGRLAYEVNITARDPRTGRPELRSGLADADTGLLLRSWPRLQTAGPGSTEGTGTSIRGGQVSLALTRTAGGYSFVDTTRAMYAQGGTISTYDLGGTDGSKPVPPASTPTLPAVAATTTSGAVDAHHNLGEVYEFYRARLGRNAIDGKGGSIAAKVNYRMFPGEARPNAAWDPETETIYFGGGDPTTRSFAAALDVTGHELTHGVITHTANLNYLGQSGAISEALADYFGNAAEVEARHTPMTSPAASVMGEDLCEPGTKPQDCWAVRNLLDGSTTFKNFQGTVEDFYGVHLNSTIYSGALWRIRRALGGPVADRLVYATLVQHMTPATDFLGGRQATLAAAKDLGLTPAQIAVINREFDASGIVPGWQERLGTDTRTLVDSVPYDAGFRDPAPAVGGHVWTISMLEPDFTSQAAIWAGDLDGTRRRRISPQDGWLHNRPSTDGRSVVWMAVNPADGRCRTWQADLKAKTAWVLTESRDVCATPVVQGSRLLLVTSTVQDDPLNSVTTFTLRIGDRERILARIPGDASAVELKDDTIAFTRTRYRGSLEDPATLETEVTVDTLNTQTRSLRTVAKAVSGKINAFVGFPRLIARDLVYLADMDGDGHVGIVRVDRQGVGRPTVLIAEGPTSPMYPEIDASDQALNLLEHPAVMEWGVPTPRMQQMLLTGTDRRLRTFSCNRGDQGPFAMDNATGAAWIDVTTGTPKLVYLDKRRETCPQAG